MKYDPVELHRAIAEFLTPFLDAGALREVAVFALAPEIPNQPLKAKLMIVCKGSGVSEELKDGIAAHILGETFDTIESRFVVPKATRQ